MNVSSGTHHWRIFCGLFCAYAVLSGGGCFSERSHPLRATDVILVNARGSDGQQSARQWLVETHEQLRQLLPRGHRSALLTGDMTTSHGRPIDVGGHFLLRFEDMDSILGNPFGMLHTAQLASTRAHQDKPPSPWPGFGDVWIPVSQDVQLSGRLGFAVDADGGRKTADCIVLLPGLLGDNDVLRNRDLAVALRDNGFHVLALEQRGSGQTETRYPHVPTSWGILESHDLLAVAEWLQAMPEIERTGLIGFCWGANTALLTAWADGRASEHRSITPELARSLPPRNEDRHFTAGVIAFSPTLTFEKLIDRLDTPRSIWTEPILYAFQQSTRARQHEKGRQPADGKLRTLIHQEMACYDWGMPDPVWHGLRYLRLMPYKTEPAGDKLEDVRVPVLIIKGANDPVTPAQDLADLMAMTENPNVAGLILPGGGHVGFAAYARAYYFSLILNFFDRRSGPAGAAGGSLAGLE